MMRVLVTGGARGIGKAIVERFVTDGHFVYAPSRNELDLSKPVCLQIRDFDIVINNAGINPLSSIEQISDEQVMRVNYFSALEIVQQCLPYMVKQKYGRIVNIGSIWIEFSKEKRAAYSASKNALHSLTKSLTAEYARENILTNTVSPGFIETDLTFKNNTPEQIHELKKQIPLHRLGSVKEIANLVHFLTVPNSFITGQNIIIDGGYSCTAN